MKLEPWKALLLQLAASAGHAGGVSEHRFHPVRLWRFDLAWPALKVAFEREGFGAKGKAGRHQRVKGMTADCGKYNTAQISGWIVVRATPPMIASGQASADLIAALNERAKR